MKVFELWSDEYFLDNIERKIKFEIYTKYFVRFDRNPTKEEYEKDFEEIKKNIKCEVNNYDLGIYEE